MLKLSNEHFIVCMANSLASRYPEVYWPIKINLAARGIDVKTIRSGNLWIRDYFPVQINGKLFRFQYKKNEKYPQLDVSNEPWTGILAPITVYSHIIDGGNIVYCGGKAVMTEKIYQDNKGLDVAQLEKLLDCQIIVIPIEPGDDLGHSDGIVRFIDRSNVLVNDYSGVAKKDKRFYAYQAQVEGILDDHNLLVHHIPNAYDQWNWNWSEKEFRRFFTEADDYNPAFGYYINFLQVANLLFLPAMKIPQDAEAYKVVKKHFPECDIIMVDCSRLSFEGGLIHCVTWASRAENGTFKLS